MQQSGVKFHVAQNPRIVKQGGTLIEYTDKDPYIRKHYEEEFRNPALRARWQLFEGLSRSRGRAESDENVKP